MIIRRWRTGIRPSRCRHCVRTCRSWIRGGVPAGPCAGWQGGRVVARRGSGLRAGDLNTCGGAPEAEQARDEVAAWRRPHVVFIQQYVSYVTCPGVSTFDHL
jgi:hypothetical protein